MFSFLKRKEKQILSPMDGKVIHIEDIQDEAFSEKMLGDGVGIIPIDGTIVSPVTGEIIQVFDTLHAYGVRTDDGVEILIHIGINTVELGGRGFKTFVKSGQRVKSGEKIAEADIRLIADEGYSTQTPVIITNMEKIKEIKCSFEDAKAGESAIISYSVK